MTPEALGPNRDSSSQKGTPKCSLNFYHTSLSASLPATPHLLLPPRPLVSLCHIMALDTPQFPSTPQESLSECAHNSAKIIPFHTIPSCPQPPKGITRNKANDKKMWNPMSAISCHPSCSLGSCTRDPSKDTRTRSMRTSRRWPRPRFTGARSPVSCFPWGLLPPAGRLHTLPISESNI